jgi:CHAT domain-containing protein
MNKTRYSRVFLFIFLSMLIFSCSTIPKANLAIGQIYLGNSQKSWQMISKELKHPTVSSQEDLCELHVAAIQILESIVKYDFAPHAPDLAAKTSYDYVCKNCQAFSKKLVVAENQYGNYFFNTRRPGLGILHYKRALKVSQNDLYIQMCNLNGIAMSYADMGAFELRDYYMMKSIKTGREYFKTKRIYKYGTDEFFEWNTYKQILEQRLDNLAWSKNAKEKLTEMFGLWSEIESINRKWYSKQTQFIAYTNASQRFASAGDAVFARTLYNNAKELVEKYPGKKIEAARLDLQINEASILSAEGQLKAAAAFYKDWIERFQRASGKSLYGNDYRIAGLAQESAGNYNLAIKYLNNSIAEYEKMRSSFQVKARGRVLSGLVVTTYWGLIRSHAARYLEHRSEKDFKLAIRSAQRLRARQFGELLGISSLTEGDFDITKFPLKPDELLLNIVLTDRAIVLFAISSKWHDLFMIPYDKNSFDITVKRIKAQISTPGDTDTLFNDLKSISKMVLKPIGDRLDRYSKLIIIPDGTLNGIPFTILSKSYQHYRPLILDHEIALTPSLSYFIKNRKSDYRATSDTLFALADPDYGYIAASEAYQDETRGFYRRAVDDFKLFTPLPETRTEVANIVRLFPANNVTAIFGKEASESKIKSLNLSEYRYLHFATHGILGNQIPGVDEPALVLAAESENSGQNGFLTLSEVEEMKLNSEMAVLSACDTGSGKYFTGEGIMGLSRGFLIAGSRSVVVSLWPVASEATVEIMTLFYQHLRSGKTKAASLHLAQLAMMDSKNDNKYKARSIKVVGKAISETYDIHPFYWAPFVIIGE